MNVNDLHAILRQWNLGGETEIRIFDPVPGDRGDPSVEIIDFYLPPDRASVVLMRKRYSDDRSDPV